MLFFVNRVYNQSDCHDARAFVVAEGDQLAEKIQRLLRKMKYPWICLVDDVLETDTFDTNEKKLLEYMATFGTEGVPEADRSVVEMIGCEHCDKNTFQFEGPCIMFQIIPDE